MPPHNLFDSDCEAVPSMGKLFNSLLSSSLSTLSPMCNDSTGPRVYSPTYPMNHQPSQTSNVNSCSETSKTVGTRQTVPNPRTNVSDMRRPPLNPVKPKTISNRNRRKVGLSIDVPAFPSDPHQLPSPDGENPPPLISCAKNVELRRKSLSERHFFRPVSDDEDSAMGNKQ
ncbi:hypothetical protein ACHAWF_013801 [Thalassiosira exigua]